MPSTIFPAWSVILFVLLGIFIVGMGYYMLSVSRERIWIQVQKRNAMYGIASPPSLPEATVRSYRIRGVALMITGLLTALLPLVTQVIAHMINPRVFK